MKEKILVSACLLGRKCRYDASSAQHEAVIAYLKDKEVYAVCPELLGGLTVPRTPCERSGECVISKDGKDVTQAFQKGAQEVLNLAKKKHIKKAILKSKSPSCGYGYIYDGSFNGRLIKGNGMCSDLLLMHNIEIVSSDDM